MRIVRVRVTGRRPFTVRLGGRLSAFVTRLVRMPMLTLGATVYVRPGVLPTVEGIAHESEHVEQWHDLGRVRFALAYVLEQLRRGYKANRFEVKAREYALANAHLFARWEQ